MAHVTATHPYHGPPTSSQGDAEPLCLTNRGERVGAWILLAFGTLILAFSLWCLLVMVPDGMPVMLLCALALPGVVLVWGGAFGLRRRKGLTADASGLTLLTPQGTRHLTWDQVRGNLYATITDSSLVMMTARVAVPVDGAAVELPCTSVSGLNEEAAMRRAQVMINEILACDPGPDYGYIPERGLIQSQDPPSVGGTTPAAHPPRLVLEDPDSLRERRTASTVAGVSITGGLCLMGVVALLEGDTDTLGTVMAVLFSGAGGLVLLTLLVAHLRGGGPHRTVVDSTGITVHGGGRTEVLSWTQARGHLAASTTPLRAGKVRLGWSAELRYEDEHRSVLLAGASVQGPTRAAAMQAAQARIAQISAYDPASAPVG